MRSDIKARLCCIAFLASVGLHINAQSSNGNSATLIVTEICVANIDQTIDYSNNYGGWIEWTIGISAMMQEHCRNIG